MTNSLDAHLFFSAAIHLFLSQKFGCYVVIIVIPTILQGRPTWKKRQKKWPARDNIPPTVEFLCLSPGPQLRFWLCASWNFWLLSKGKDRLICTNLIQYRNRGFSNPFFPHIYLLIYLFVYLFIFKLENSEGHGAPVRGWGWGRLGG